MENSKPLSFSATAGSYFVLTLVSIVMMYIPFFGWAFLLNYVSQWFADNALVNGKKVTYQAGYGESLKFVFVNTLLTIITFGIYMFWFAPKLYAYAADHMQYSGDVPVAAEPVAAVAVEPVAPAVPTESVVPVVPAPPVESVTPSVEPTPPADSTPPAAPPPA